jgi:hypothetical protein
MTTSAKPYIGRRGMSFTVAVLQLVAAVALVVAVVLPINQLTQPGGDVTVTFADDGAERSLDLRGLPEGVSVADAEPTAVLHAFELPVALRALTESSSVLAALAVAAGSWSIRRGQPFDRRNHTRLAGVAAAVVLGGVVAPMAGNVAANTVLGHLGLLDPGSPFAFVIVELPFNPLLLAALVLAIAEAFRRGGALADEVEGMV